MTANQVREALHAQPFQPFRIHMSDGSTYEIWHRDFALVTRRVVTIGIPVAGDDMPDRAVWCDPLHITRIELLPEGKPRQRRNGR